VAVPPRQEPPSYRALCARPPTQLGAVVSASLKSWCAAANFSIETDLFKTHQPNGPPDNRLGFWPLGP